jgi:hypothetical protein
LGIGAHPKLGSPVSGIFVCSSVLKREFFCDSKNRRSDEPW